MSQGPTSDPIFPDKPLVPPAGHPTHEKHPSGADWVVVHRGGAGSKAHVEALERKLIKAHVSARVEHDDEHRVVLEVPRDQEAEAMQVLGEANTHGAGSKAHENREVRMEESEQLHGAFAATNSKWLIWVLVFAVFALLVGGLVAALPLFR
jgi:hypothetical protein